MRRTDQTYLQIALAILSAFMIFPFTVYSQEKEKSEKGQEVQQDKSIAGRVKPDPDTLAYYYLLDGPDVQGNLDYALMTAAAEGNVTGINWLIKNGAEMETTTPENNTPLHIAVANNKKESVKALLDNGANPNAISNLDETPLIIAVKNENIEIAEILLRDSADINLADRYDATPLHYASIYGYFYIVDLLLYYDAAVYKKTVDGTTPLMAAIWSGFADIADLLMQNGADPSEKDNLGFTPFLIAAQNGDTVIMNLLLKRRVNIYATNNFNYNALDLCIKGNHKMAVAYLLRTGDKWSAEEHKAINPFLVASAYRRKEIPPMLRQSNIPEIINKGIDQITITPSVRFCLHDYQTGISVTAKEPVLNIGFLGGIDFKPGYTRVLVKEEEDYYYQYRDKSALIYAGIMKDFPLTDYPLKGNWSFFGSLSVAYSFGNKLKGTNIVPGNEFRINPSAGFKWIKNSFGINLALEYLNTDFYLVGPVWLRLGFSYLIYKDKIQAPGKVIKWY
jgi:ankyrin repeat protein